MNDDSRTSISGRRFRAFATVFAVAFLLGGVVMGVEFFEFHPKKVETEALDRSSTNQRLTLEAKLRAAHARTADARRQADAAELAVFVFLNDRFVDSAEPATEQPHPVRVGPTIRPNPEWVELNRQLSAMQQRRAELLVNLMPAHPTVQALESDIAKTQDRLAATPAELPIDANQVPNETPAERETVSTSSSESLPRTIPQSHEMQRDYRNLLLAAGRARDVYRTVLASESADWNACQHGGSPMIAMDRAGSIDLRPRETNVHSPTDRAIPIGAIAILTLLSIFAGVLAARRIERRTLTFMNAQEIEATLGLPVLGRLGAEAVRRTEDAA